MRINKLLLVTLLVLTMSSISALHINNALVNVTKTSQIDKPITFTLTNDNEVTMYNISFEDNDYIRMDTIPSLSSGQSVNVTAYIFKDENVIGKDIRIKGFYEAGIGHQVETYDVNVLRDSNSLPYVQPCDFSIIQGDSVSWLNTAFDSIEMVDSDTSVPLVTINRNQPYTNQFISAEIFSYYFKVSGFTFGQCDITILSDTGQVNNPAKDAIINLNVDVSFDPTTVSLNVPVTTYNVTAIGSKEGLFSITNTGNKIAKGINIEGEWLIFSKNNFDLQAGETTTVGYTLDPIITDTSQTDKTYNKNIIVKGNFETQTKTLSVYVQYAKISGIGTNMTEEEVKTLVEVLCSAFPDLDICQPQIVYSDGFGNGSATVSKKYTEEQIDDIWLYLFSLGDELRNKANIQTEKSNDMSNATVELRDDIDAINKTISEFVQERGDNKDGLIIFLIILSLLIIIASTLTISWMYKRKKKAEDLRRF